MGVLVAGGTGGLGGAVVRELLHAGYDVTVADRRGDAPEGAAMVEADLLDPAAAAAAVGGVAELEGVVNLIGGFGMGPKVEAAELEEFERLWRLNLVPAFTLARAAMPRLAARGGGAFVCVSAKAALEPFSGATGYISAKAAVLAFVRALDAEYRDAGVRANAILPSVIDTPANREAMPDSDWSKWVAPEQIGRVIRFLVSDDSEVTSGAAVPVYGRA
ncbi:MAG TPA: SDR family NAD(P)-dependent oxidoreductase [Thermoleophilaceae bacterium]|nr:SDR family NAD(P)-dependent oxidoreductase [Thermoleophilaceae bacterium]